MAGKRRAKGEGGIFQRKDGVWVASYNGKRLYAKTKTEVTQKLNTYKAEYLAGYEERKNPTVKAYVNEFLSVKEMEIKASSYQRLESTFNSHIIYRIGDMHIKDITPAIISNKVLKAMQKEGLAYSSVKKAYDALNALLRYAKYNRIIPFNPMELVGKPKQVNFNQSEETEVRFFTDEEKVRFIDACYTKYSNGTPMYINFQGFILMLNTGMRLGEATGLLWENVDFAKKRIIVKTTLGLTKKNGLELMNYTKNSKSRIIPLNKTAIKALEELRDWQSKHNLTSAYVICTSKGTPVLPATYIRKFEAICHRANIQLPDFHKVHVLRHTFATSLFRKGVNIKVVSELLGHSSTKITMDIYVHVIQEQNLEAVGMIDDI